MPEVITPDWVKHAVFYQIFPDRFASSDHIIKPHNLEPWDTEPTTFGYKGGDLFGVIEHLDYLQDLGVTALYFNPIFQSASNHRYHTHDYFQVDPLLGGNDAFDALLAACKQRGIRIILDGVFNHASRGFFQFNDVLENGAASPWVDWFNFHQFPANAYDLSQPPGYTAWWGMHALPKLNTDNPQVREYLMQVGEYWVRKGIDGWRLDVAGEITSEGFWQEFRRRVKAINPEAYLVAELWDPSPGALQGDQFDATMNYPFTSSVIAFTAGARVQQEMVQGRGYHPYPPLSGVEYAERIDQLLGIYPWPVELAQFNLLDSHDTSRFLSVAGGDVASVRLGMLLLLTYPGAPCIYYGDEIGLTGGPSDALARKTFPWQAPETWDWDLLQWTKGLIALRHAQPALRTGSYRRLAADLDAYAFARAIDETGTLLIVAINVAENDRMITIPLREVRVRDSAPTLLFGQAEFYGWTPEALTIQLPARGCAVLDLSSE